MSNNRKQLSELTIKDNFMFAAVMLDLANCKPLLEMILGIEIGEIEVSREKSIVYNPEYHGVRLDVYAKDKFGSHYNIEMQVRKSKVVKRSRYYHSQMDMELLATGVSYEKLPDSYVIFICDYDPMECGKYRYTQVSRIEELPEYQVMDGRKCIYLSTCGRNRNEVPEKLVRFLEYVKSNPEEDMESSNDSYVEQLKAAIERIKKSREMGSRYMIFQEMMQEEYENGKAEGLSQGEITGRIESILELLEERGTVSSELEESIRNYTDLETLKKLFRIAAKAENVEQFVLRMKEI